MRRVASQLVVLIPCLTILSSALHAQLWKPFRAEEPQSLRESAPRPPSIGPASWIPQLRMPRLIAPASERREPAGPTVAQRFNASTQRVFSRTKAIVTAPIDSMSQATSNMTHWFDRSPPSGGDSSRESVFPGIHSGTEKTEGYSGPPRTVPEWLGQERPE